MPTRPSRRPPSLPLRRALQQQRAALPIQLQQHLSRQAASHLGKQALFRNARHIALYLPVRGEADPTSLRKLARPGQIFYLPVLSPLGGNRLWFVRWDHNTRLRLNRFRIPEPSPNHRRSRPARWLDLVVTPLVAFDWQGTRMGMGGGFYDRTFAFKRMQPYPQRPCLCGFSYNFQNVNHIDRQTWDVPLNAVASDAGFFQFSTGIY